MKLIITAPDADQLIDYAREVGVQMEDGYTSGHVDAETHWEIAADEPKADQLFVVIMSTGTISPFMYESRKVAEDYAAERNSFWPDDNPTPWIVRELIVPKD